MMQVQFTIDRKTFATEVGKVARYLPERTRVPVLGGILVEVDALGVTLTVTDYEVLARTFAAADVETPGRFLVLGVHLARIARNLPADAVHVECDGRNVTITSGRARFTLLTMPEQDYPDMSKLGPGATCQVVDMDTVKPRGADAHERGRYVKRGLETVKMWRAPGRTSRLYEPADFQPGAWITWTREVITRYYGGPNGTMTHSEKETVTMTSQVWSLADRVRSVWAIVEGEDHASRVTEYDSSLHETVCVNTDVKAGTIAA